jgi:hypothetical protein
MLPRRRALSAPVSRLASAFTQTAPLTPLPSAFTKTPGGIHPQLCEPRRPPLLRVILSCCSTRSLFRATAYKEGFHRPFLFNELHALCFALSCPEPRGVLFQECQLFCFLGLAHSLGKNTGGGGQNQSLTDSLQRRISPNPNRINHPRTLSKKTRVGIPRPAVVPTGARLVRSGGIVVTRKPHPSHRDNLGVHDEPVPFPNVQRSNMQRSNVRPANVVSGRCQNVQYAAKSVHFCAERMLFDAKTCNLLHPESGRTQARYVVYFSMHGARFGKRAPREENTWARACVGRLGMRKRFVSGLGRPWGLAGGPAASGDDRRRRRGPR